MDTKLTLKLDSFIIEKAKIYARKKNTSLSHLIETYLNFLTNPKGNDEEVTPLVKSLSGIIDLPKNFDYKKSHKSHLSKKYSK
jgi:hypothetical protein